MRFVWMGLLQWILICPYHVCGQKITELQEQIRNQVVEWSSSNHFNLVLQGYTRFAFDLYRPLRKQRENLIFSPYSVSTALIMVALGAKHGTLAQLQNVIRYSTSLTSVTGDLNDHLLTIGNRNEGQLFLVNALWFQEGLKIMPAIEILMQRDFQMLPQFVNFSEELNQSLKTINQWVSQRSHNRLNFVLHNQDLSSDTQFLITSGMWMKGQWTQPFDLKQTVRTLFQLSQGKTLRIDLMKVTAPFLLSVQEKFDLIQVPFLNQTEKGPKLALLIMLPKNQTTLEQIEELLTYENWKQWLEQATERLVNLALPKFKVESRLDLNPFLIHLGMSIPFTPEADFSGFTGSKKIYLNTIVHKASLRIDEKGSEVSGALLHPKTVKDIDPTTPYDFIADHPFLFFIIDQRTKTLLMMGRIVRP
jgi:serpin B